MFKLEIETDNASFDGDMYHIELQRCLERALQLVKAQWDSGTIRDTDGNRVGHFFTTNRGGRARWIVNQSKESD